MQPRLFQTDRSEPSYCEEQDLPKDNSWLLWVCVIGLCLMMLFGLAGCAQAQTLTASWYSIESLNQEGTWAYSHGVMANGRQYKDSGLTCAARIFPLGSIIKVENLTNHKAIIVKVTDRIGRRFANKRIDLSKAAFEHIADLSAGVIKISVRRVK